MNGRRVGHGFLAAGWIILLVVPAWGATAIYRSVGPGNTSALASGGTTSLTISGTTATFSQPLPANVGVGDAVQYSSSQICFIHVRTDSIHYTVYKADGLTAPTTVNGDTGWSVFRAYTSLANALTATENTGIAAGIQNFDTWSGGANLVSNNWVWNIACYGDNTDTTAPRINSWTTGPNNYLRVYAPYLTAEVGAGQRHSGVWNTTTAYRLVLGNSTGIVINPGSGYSRFEGLQLEIQDTSGCNGIEIDDTGTIDTRISGCIIRNGNLSDASNPWGIVVRNTPAGGTMTIWNNILYDWVSSTNVCAIYTASAPVTSYIYNNTFHNSGGGIINAGGTIVAKNNVGQGSATSEFSGTFAAASCNNVSDFADAPGTNPRNSKTVTFVDSTNANHDLRNFHLAAGDLNAKDFGADLSGDANKAFNDDIDGQTRPYPPAWDSGADEYWPLLSPTPTITATTTRSPTLTITPTSTRTSTPTPSYTPTATPSATPSFTVTPTPTPSSTRTGTATPTITLTWTPTASPTTSPTATGTFTITPTASITLTVTATPTITLTSTITPLWTLTATGTSTAFQLGLQVAQVIAYPLPAKHGKIWFYFEAQAPAQARIDIFNVMGETCRQIQVKVTESGGQRTSWDIDTVASGVYLYRLHLHTAQGNDLDSGFRKLVVVK